MRRSSFLAALALAAGPAAAEDGKLEASAELRLRVEAVTGQSRPGAAPTDAALFARTLIAAEYDAGPLRIGGELADSRAYFERRGSTVGANDVNALEPLQAYVATDVSDRFRLLAGRFTLNLGSRRLIARNAFRNTINGFTGVQAQVGEAKRTAAQGFWMIAQTRLPDDAAGIRDNAVELDRERGSPRLFGGFVAHRAGPDLIEGYAIRLAEGDTPGIQTRDRRLWTIGGRLLRAPAKGKWDGEIEAAWQGGTARETTLAADRRDLPVRAGFAHAAIGYTFAGAWRPRLALLGDYASGETRGRSLTRFDPLYSARVFEFAPSGLYAAVTRTNILSPAFRVEAQPDDRTEAHVALRPLWLAGRTDAFSTTQVRDATGRSGRYAGTQGDWRVRRTLTDALRLNVGMVHLFKGRFLATAPNAPRTGDTHYGYVELTIAL